ncbi:MAG: hypothetical protein JSR46_08560, partial [Verrucomicrobia bacterium]|nr:hypothetical protein [Verrucomicrobiota bacterium]
MDRLPDNAAHLQPEQFQVGTDAAREDRPVAGAEAPPEPVQTPIIDIKFSNIGANPKDPTMSIINKALTANGLTYDNVTDFRAELPTKGNAVELETAKRGGSTYFQAKMTFFVTAGEGDQKKILRFTQIIETSVKVPFNGDNIETQAAMKKALCLIEGYRQAIGEPLMQEQNETIKREALNALAEKSSFTVKTTQLQAGQGLPGHSIQQTLRNDDVTTKVKKIFENTTHPATIQELKIGNTPFKTEETLKKSVFCDAITTRDDELNTFIEQAAADNPSRIVTPHHMDHKSTLNVIIRNTFNDINDLNFLLESNAKIIETLSPRIQTLRQEVHALTQQIQEAEAKDPMNSDNLRELNAKKSQKFTEAESFRHDVDETKIALNRIMEGIETNIKAVGNVLADTDDS